MSAPQTRPQIMVASETRDFRHMVRKHITPEDFFLEIGCSFGECTRLLGELGCSGVALDHSTEAVTQTRLVVEVYVGISVAQADARDIATIHHLCPTPSVILFDVGGNEPLDKVTSLLRLLLKTFHPRLLLVKSMELAEFSSLIQDYTLPDRPHLLAPFDDAPIPHPLLELSHSPVMNDRLFALHRLRHSVQQDAVLKRIQEMCQDASPTVRKQANHILKAKRNS